MSLAERLDRLDAREKKLLGVLFALFVGFVVLLVPVGISAALGSTRDANLALAKAVSDIVTSRSDVRKRALVHDAVVERYASPAPPLAGFLAGLAKEHTVEIPESQDQADVPHGKRYNERSTKIVLKKTPLLNLSKFLEAIGKSGHPVALSRLNVRKRGTEPDSYDVELVVSAFDRTEEPAKSDGTEEAAE